MSPQVEKVSVNVTLVTIVIAMLALGGFTYRAGLEVSDIKGRVTVLEADCEEMKGKVSVCEAKSHRTDIKLAEISTDLKNISTTLIKIEKKIP